VDPDVEKYARECGKPFLDYQEEEDYVDAYNDFYDAL
jgi:starch synthase